MKELDPLVFLAVFHEMLGPWLWVLLGLAALTTAAFIWLLLRQRGIAPRRLVFAQLLGLAGGALALVLMAKVSSSGFTDAAGPADWILITLVFALGAIGATIVTYTTLGWCRRSRKQAG